MPPFSSPTDLLLPVGPPRLGHPPADAVGEGEDGQDGVDAAVGDVQRCIDDVQVVMSPDVSRIGACRRVGTSYPDRGTTWHRWGRAAAGLPPATKLALRNGPSVVRRIEPSMTGELWWSG